MRRVARTALLALACAAGCVTTTSTPFDAMPGPPPRPALPVSADQVTPATARTCVQALDDELDREENQGFQNPAPAVGPAKK